MTRNLVLSALLFTMPFSGMRVICVESTTAPVDTGSDCERLCARHHVAGTATGSNCLLSADACSLLAVATTMAVAPEEPLHEPLVTATVFAEAPRYCPEPDLAHRVPPPKPQVLR